MGISGRRKEGESDACPVWVGQRRSFGNYAQCGRDGIGSSSNRAIYHVWAGQRGSIRNNALCERTREDFQRSCSLWTRPDMGFQQEGHIRTYVGGQRKNIRIHAPCERVEAGSSSSYAVYMSACERGKERSFSNHVPCRCGKTKF